MKKNVFDQLDDLYIEKEVLAKQESAYQQKKMISGLVFIKKEREFRRR